MVVICRCEVSQRFTRIRNPSVRDCQPGNLTRTNHPDRAFFDRVANKRVPIDIPAGDRDKKISPGDLAGIELDRVDLNFSQLAVTLPGNRQRFN